MSIFTMAKSMGLKFMIENRIDTPLDIQSALAVLQVQSISIPLDKIGAFTLLNEDNEKLLVFNCNYSSEEQRFFIAHEISHIILGHEGVYIDSIDSLRKITFNRYEERLASICAGELLMPGYRLRKLAGKYRYDVKYLKKIFWVPELVLVIRLKEMGLPYCNTVFMAV